MREDRFLRVFKRDYERRHMNPLIRLIIVIIIILVILYIWNPELLLGWFNYLKSLMGLK